MCAGYYDLSTAGLPVHATAFRATDLTLLENPFRIFTSLLRLDLIADEATRELARCTLAARDIFSTRCAISLSSWTVRLTTDSQNPRPYLRRRSCRRRERIGRRRVHPLCSVNFRL